MLARKSNQSIMVGDDIEIKIIEIKGDQIKIGVAAPRSVSVHRKEVYDEIKEANLQAATLTSTNSKLTEVSKKLKKAPSKKQD